MRIAITNNGWQAEIETLGAELKSLKSPDHKEYVWNSDPEFWPRSSPLLFPSIGNVRNGKTHIGGTEYPMNKHGFCKESDFAVKEQTESRLTLSLQDNDHTRESYPFAFELCLTYELQGQQLLMTYQVTNRDAQPMVYHLGAHPGFFCPLEENESFSDYVLEFEKEEKMESVMYDLENLCFSMDLKMVHGEPGRVLSLAPEKFDNDALFFYHPNSKAVTLKHPGTGKGIYMEYPDFASIAFWTPIGGKAPFLCLEPWNGAAIFADEDDNFEHKRDIQTLEAGKTKEYHLKVKVL